RSIRGLRAGCPAARPRGRQPRSPPGFATPARHRHRRVGARTGELLRALRHPPDAWPASSDRHDGAGAQFGHDRLVRPRRLGEAIPMPLADKLVVAVDAFAFADPEVGVALRPMVELLRALVGEAREELL